MKKILLAATFVSFSMFALAQTTPVKVSKVVNAEEAFNKLVERKGIKDGFLAVAAPDGIVFKPDAVNIVDFYTKIDKQEGKLSWQPKFARISANGDLAFTAGPYVYQNGKGEDDKVFGDYVSIWRADAEDGKLKLLIDLGIQHPEPETEAVTDFKETDATGKTAPSKDPFTAKSVIINTDKIFNHALTLSTMASYKEFLSPEGRYYFPGFEPMTGPDVIMKFINNQAISISAETTDGGRSVSNDLAYSYGKARITKGNVVGNYNYVRIWEIDQSKKWNILLEVFSSIENE
jgi:ketosteroid isomerase-like protein